MSKPNDPSEQDFLIMEKMYLEDRKSLDNIAALYNTTRARITRIFRDNNVPIRTARMSNSKQLTTEQIAKLIHVYVVEKKGLVSAGKAVGVCQDKAKKVLVEAGIPIRTYNEAKDASRKYSVNDNYFKNQSHNMAYILGLIAADGNVSVRENLVSIALRDYDFEILEKIRVELQSERPVKLYTRADGTKFASLQIWSKTMKSDLSNYNITPRKTETILPPTFLAKEYWRSYIRGYFDGDGSINNYNQSWGINIGGASHKVIQWMFAYLISELQLELQYKTPFQLQTNRLPSGKQFYSFTFYGDNAKRIIQHIYVPNSLAMKRKSDICLSL